MKYRAFGKTGVMVSQLGFGCMRLPVINGDMSNIDEAKAMQMIRHGIDRGINYLDTAYPYHSKGFHGSGESELFLAKVLKDGYSDKVHLATKLPTWLVSSREDMERLLDEQLARLETDVIDFYLLHAIRGNTWDNLIRNDVFAFLDEAKKVGKVKYVGFSFHDEFPLFKEVVDAYDWDFCQIQLNYLDIDYQAGLKGLNYASEKGLGISIMEPLRGGALVANQPNEVKAIFHQINKDKTPAEWAFKWLYHLPQVSMVLSGMSEMEHVKENLAIAHQYGVGNLTMDEEVAYKNVKAAYDRLIKVNCTACGYCMPCPAGVNIPVNFQLYNEHNMFKNGTSIYCYQYQIGNQKASSCVQCGKCESHCPQSIKIMDRLADVDKHLGLNREV